MEPQLFCARVVLIFDRDAGLESHFVGLKKAQKPIWEIRQFDILEEEYTDLRLEAMAKC